MRHSKIILVACISAIVAITTAFLGVTGTVIGSVLSSVFYNVLSEFLEEPLEKSSLNKNFEWELIYAFPLIVIALIQFLLILAFLSQWGVLPSTFLNAYLLIQNIADNNLYRILGISLLVMSIYPFVLKPNTIKKSHGVLIAFVGLIFLARGFSDADNIVSTMSHVVFRHFDFPIAILAFILLVYVTVKITFSAYNAYYKGKNLKNVPNNSRIRSDDLNDLTLKKISSNDFNKNNHSKNTYNKVNKKQYKDSNNRNLNKKIIPKKHNNIKNTLINKKESNINTSVEDIEFTSNDLLKEFKKK